MVISKSGRIARLRDWDFLNRANPLFAPSLSRVSLIAQERPCVCTTTAPSLRRVSLTAQERPCVRTATARLILTHDNASTAE